jgi:hypothetical protein
VAAAAGAFGITIVASPIFGFGFGFGAPTSGIVRSMENLGFGFSPGRSGAFGMRIVLSMLNFGFFGSSGTLTGSLRLAAVTSVAAPRRA